MTARREIPLKRLLLIGAGVAGAGLGVRRAARCCGSLDVEKMLERMPEHAPTTREQVPTGA